MLKCVTIKLQDTKDTAKLPKASREEKDRIHTKNKESERFYWEQKTKEQCLQNSEKNISNLKIAT